jgi:Flp pilus assembly protein TadG
MKRRFGRLSRSQAGTATIELALLAPMLAAMVMGISDLSIVVGRRLELEQAAHRAIERVMQTTGTLTVEDTIKQEVVCQINGMEGGECAEGRMTADKTTVTYRLECTDAGGTRTTQQSTLVTEFETYECAEGSTAARYVLVQVTDTYDPLFPYNYGSGPDGIYQLTAEAGVRVP